MKKFLFISLFSGLLLSAMAQKNNVQSAANTVKYKEWADGKKYIDLAAVHPKTSNSPKMWYYRGRVYLGVHEDKQKTVDPDAIGKSTESLVNCLNVDEGEMYKDSATYYLMRAAILCFYEGIGQYKAGEYEKAAKLYDLVLKSLKHDKSKDLARNNVSEKTVTLYLYYAASGAEDKEKSKTYLEKLIEMNYNDPKIYLFMSRLQQEEGDTASALSSIEKGRERFYDDKNLIKEQVALSIILGKSEELMKKLNEDIEYDQGNASLYVIRGTMYEKQGNLESAIVDYKEAVDINPSLFIANYNLGAIYFNDGVQIMNKAKDILSNDLYNKEKAKADAKFKEALPYFETAYELDPKDQVVAQSLLRLYVRVGEDEKYQQLKAKFGK